MKECKLTRPPNPMDIILDRQRKTIIQNTRHIRNIQPPRRHIRRHQQPYLPILKRLQRRQTSRLRQIAVETFDGVACTLECGFDAGGFFFVEDEDEDAVGFGVGGVFLFWVEGLEVFEEAGAGVEDEVRWERMARMGVLTPSRGRRRKLQRLWLICKSLEGNGRCTMTDLA